MATTASNFSYIGTGWSFPPVFDNVQGGVNMVTGFPDINESLWILLNTAKGERVMLTGYGCDLRQWLFQPMNSSNIAIIKNTVQRAINLYEARIVVNAIDVLIDQLADGILKITIDYTLRTTNSRYNVVFPFFLTEATDIGALGIGI
jgi:phage baseplate assembly protein W